MNTNELLEQAQLGLMGLLRKGQVCLAAFLEEKLPTLYTPDDKTWWDHRVIRQLKPLQIKKIDQKSIDKLDLAGLLDVLIGNWKDISGVQGGFPLAHQIMEIRHVVQAHSTTEDIKELSVEDIYRHLDTLERFLKVIEGDEHLVQRVRNSKFNMVPLLLDQELPRDPLSGGSNSGALNRAKAKQGAKASSAPRPLRRLSNPLRLLLKPMSVKTLPPLIPNNTPLSSAVTEGLSL